MHFSDIAEHLPYQDKGNFDGAARDIFAKDFYGKRGYLYSLAAEL